MKKIEELTNDEIEREFKEFINVKSADRYINELKKAYELIDREKENNSIFDIKDENILIKKVKPKLIKTNLFNRKTPGGTPARAGFNAYVKYINYKKSSYCQFFNDFKIKEDDFINWGIKQTIFGSDELIKTKWERLKKSVIDGLDTVYVRGYGRNPQHANLMMELYGYLFPNAIIKKNSNNNSIPSSKIEKLTGLKKNKDIFNYQVAHVWGKTKNPLLFEAPWNICYIPKIIDPLTGHESKGSLTETFRIKWLKRIKKKYRKYIDEYNKIIIEYKIETKIKEFYENKKIKNSKFLNDALEEFSTIKLEENDIEEE